MLTALDIRRINTIYWVHFADIQYDRFEQDKVGKWMIHFLAKDDNFDYYTKLAKDLVEAGLTAQTKVSRKTTGYTTGVLCIYMNIDETYRHIRLLESLIDRQAIPREASGILRDIEFKLDKQTLEGLYGPKFIPKLKLGDLVDLKTGSII